MGDIHVVGAQGTAGAGQGGTIYFRNSTRDQGDSGADPGGDQEREQGRGGRTFPLCRDALPDRRAFLSPSRTISCPISGMCDGDHAPYYAAPSVDLKGYIYNPRGTVTATSANGDVYNKGNDLRGQRNV